VAEHAEVGRLAVVRRAIASIEVDADVVVIASPHGKATGVYARNSGDLSDFGVDFHAEWARDGDVSRLLVAEWGQPMLRHVPDHGIVVPLACMDLRGTPVVAVSFEDGPDPWDAAGTLWGAVAKLGLERRVLFIASANGSSGLTPKAPLTELEGAHDAEDGLEYALRNDTGRLVTAAPIAADAGSCGLGPLVAFGALFAQRKAEVLAHEWPFGVGYLVATAK
jgi:hypothetical protein